MGNLIESLSRVSGATREVVEIASRALDDIRPRWEELDELAAYNHSKVLEAFRRARVQEGYFWGSTGYGYGDAGREKLDEIYAEVFGTEKALVRGQIVSGTHAIALALYGVLRPGDELLGVTGEPYDTLQGIVGIREGEPGSLSDWGVCYRQVDLGPDGRPDLDAIRVSVGARTKAAFIQRSRGYSWRPPVSVESIGAIVRAVKAANPGTVCIVDNCYGEFVETSEPTEVGADLIAGSLIKNPGGGLAPTGGYLAGRADLVEAAANRLTAPGLGTHVGATAGWGRAFYQGMFLAPHVVAEALKGAVFAARLFELLGLETSPGVREPRTDIIQAVRLGSPEALVAFCQGLQKCSPVDSHVKPEPWPMPGYAHQVIMAAGAFTQGASIELSADGPMREPYVAYLQGGLTKEHVVSGVLSAVGEMRSRGLLTQAWGSITGR